ncbi:SDR family oxidoreductase [Deinococcus yavapaiensis]|uniref:NADP-dependent 3-hydroxy acid dehydrogenase YdfG n=1 Tax=Deinococcus yavapaiensis KR-236 TaxID=694435 RepID=A0A318SDK1_9DEIO|nr:SDR family oxidoreductase [Deinococcus yavapaiensis]PYE50478.1 NADP-dependent 3-hydroxy acid dehydrogenase YdfG [Deinococcus yavapaiensis KR-236]
MSKVWFITGASRGFGEAFARAALERGDRVAGTARRVEDLEGLRAFGDAFLPLHLDVTDRAADIAAVQQAHAHFGALDVVVNNAGYGHFGFFEEITEEEARAQMETNLFGAMWVTQAAVPIMRAQGRGHIVQISSIGGVGAFPSLGIYHASKWALEGMSEALAQEVAGQGIKVTLVEPGSYGTDWSGSSATRSTPNPLYDGFRQAMAQRAGQMTYGDAKQAAQALLKVVDSENPPLRILFGAQAFDIAQGVYASRVQTWKAWEDVSRNA